MPTATIKKLSLCFLTSLYAFFCYAQGEANIWYFGVNAGIDFNTGAPVSITSPVNTWEGTAVMSDADGNLMFYTDGSIVWDKTDAEMPNGFGLLGNFSSTQAALIVPLPGSSTLSYVFTTDELAGSNGLKYSIVDMTLHAGLGDITDKNVDIISPVCEKVTAVKQCNNVDYWILTHEFGTNDFYAFPLTAAGLGSPVISSVGSVVNGSSANSRGELKLSPDGTKLAIANDYLSSEVFNFDIGTGEVSDPLTLTTGIQHYGVSFSPDNSRLYMTTGWIGTEIVQYDMTAADIAASETLVGSTDAIYSGSLLNAPDGKMYVATYGAGGLGVINSPNLLGVACDYDDDGFEFDSGDVNWGLPNFVVSINSLPHGTSINVDSCASSIHLFAGAVATSYLWSTGSTDAAIDISVSGSYWVEIQNGSCVYTDTFVVDLGTPPVISLGNDTLLCPGAGLILDPEGPAGAEYLWQDGSSDETLSASEEGTYWVQVITGGCISTDTIHVDYAGANSISLGNDTIVCAGETVVLDATIPGADYTWQDGSTDAVLTASSSGTYWIVVSLDGCTFSDTLILEIQDPLSADLGKDTVLCPYQTLYLNVYADDASYVWQDGSTDASFLVSSAGTYSVEVSEGGCIASDEITIAYADYCTDGICKLFVPNAFTPNGDGINDYFRVLPSCQPDNFEMSIYNRWGELIFQSADQNNLWDGKYDNIPQLIGSYVYTVTYQFPDDNPQIISGSVSIIR